MDWVGLTLIRHPEMEQVFTDASERKMTIHHPARFQIHWWNQDQIDQQLRVQPPTEAVVAPTPSTTAPERLLNRLGLSVSLQQSDSNHQLSVGLRVKTSI